MKINRMINKPIKFTRIKHNDGSVQCNSTKPKHKMKNLKKYLDNFYWYDLPNDELINKSPETKERIDYPSTYQTYFGAIPVVFLRITDKILPLNKSILLQKYLISENFDLCECGYESLKYINSERKIVMSGDVYVEKTNNDTDNDTDDADYNIPTISRPEDNIYISILPTIENRKFIEQIIKKFSIHLIDVSKDVERFYLIAQNQNGLFTQKTKFKAIPIKDDKYDIFYGKNFPHEKMKRFISEETENLMLLHGDPGTGKSNYIKHIITNSKKKVIYIPPSMLSVISSPGFVTFMMENKDTILLIEDAEEVLSVDRNSATNNLLGLTDGFLKDALNLKIIATFNCNIGKIDPALMRKGRMYLEYKFDELTIDECKDLADFVGKSGKIIDKPMTLAEFFNEEDNHIVNSFEERRIGFV